MPFVSGYVGVRFVGEENDLFMPFLSLTRIPDGLGFQGASKLRQVFFLGKTSSSFEAAKIVRVVLFPREGTTDVIKF